VAKNTGADTRKRVTYFAKEPIACPVCRTELYREDLLTGSGRLIAGELTDELRRLYEPSKKFGEVFPLIYPVTVCPQCYYSSFQTDFLQVEREAVEAIQADTDKRKAEVATILPDLDFSQPRDLEEGVASYFLAMSCYEHFDKSYSPTIKQGLCALRAAWIFDDLHRRNPNENYDYLSLLFYRKARFLYEESVNREQQGKESLNGLANLGPDMDRNYAYDGVLYITGLLGYKYGDRRDSAKRIVSLERARRILARVHGMGKASKSKPSAMLDRVKDLYDQINEEVKALIEEGAQTGGSS
jgi:uncharacterized protein (DUF2225 family)